MSEYLALNTIYGTESGSASLTYKYACLTLAKLCLLSTSYILLPEETLPFCRLLIKMVAIWNVFIQCIASLLHKIELTTMDTIQVYRFLKSLEVLLSISTTITDSNQYNSLICDIDFIYIYSNIIKTFISLLYPALLAMILSWGYIQNYKIHTLRLYRILFKNIQ